jgi:hypothetical protein
MPEQAIGEASRPAAFAHDTLDPGRYTSVEFVRLERERLWAKRWLMACREDQLASVGAVVTFDIAGQSIVVVRSAPDALSANHNACPHRGRRILSDCSRQTDPIPPLLEVQRGLHSLGLGELRLNPVQEKRISHFHEVIDHYLAWGEV